MLSDPSYTALQDNRSQKLIKVLNGVPFIREESRRVDIHERQLLGTYIGDSLG